MSRPSGPFRHLLTALMVVLFVAVQAAEGTGVHRCPEHDGGAGLAVAGPSHAAHHHGQGTDKPGRHGICPCLGDCQGTVPALATSGALGPDAALQVAHVRPSGRAEPLRGTTTHLLPFAIGPPIPA